MFTSLYHGPGPRPLPWEDGPPSGGSVTWMTASGGLGLVVCVRPGWGEAKPTLDVCSVHPTGLVVEDTLVLAPRVEVSKYPVSIAFLGSQSPLVAVADSPHGTVFLVDVVGAKGPVGQVTGFLTCTPLEVAASPKTIVVLCMAVDPRKPLPTTLSTGVVLHVYSGAGLRWTRTHVVPNFCSYARHYCRDASWLMGCSDAGDVFVVCPIVPDSETRGRHIRKVVAFRADDCEPSCALTAQLDGMSGKTSSAFVCGPTGEWGVALNGHVSVAQSGWTRRYLNSTLMCVWGLTRVPGMGLLVIGVGHTNVAGAVVFSDDTETAHATMSRLRVAWMAAVTRGCRARHLARPQPPVNPKRRK